MRSFRIISLLSLVLFSAVIFLRELGGPESLRAWQMFFVNLLFWSGIAQAGPVFAAIYILTGAHWSEAMKRLAIGLGTFLPLSLMLFVVFFLASPLTDWLLAASPTSHGASAIGVRNFLALLLLYGITMIFLYESIRLWRRGNGEDRGHERRLIHLSVLLLVLYAVSFSLLGFDLVMGLDGTWHSNLFGAYFFLSNFYVGVGALAILAIGASRSHQVGIQVTNAQLADLAKLLFALCLFVGYFVWSQYLVIWYGNVPEETAYLALRLLTPPWAALAWTLFSLLFLIPFVSLLWRRTKASPLVLGSVALLIMVGMWLERYMLVMPSLQPAHGLQMGWQDLTITAGFLAALILTYSLFWQRALPLTSASR